MLKKAMIMAAGVGSRLGALSDVTPKPLVPLANMATMDIIAKNLYSNNIKDVIANTYYKSEDIENYYKNNFLGIKFNFIKEETLSGTAGGLKKCQFFFEPGEDFIVMSGDGLSDIDIQDAYISHKKSGAIATIVIKAVEETQIPMYGIVVPDSEGIVSSFQEKPSIENAKSNLANTGIYIFNYAVFKYIPADTFYDFAKNVFPAVMNAGIKINTYIHKGYWSDIGSISQYKQSNSDIINNLISSIQLNSLKSENGKYVCGANFEASSTSRINGNNVFGNNCKLGENCTVTNSIIWDNVKVEDSIILPGVTVKSSVNESILTAQTEKIEQPV